MGLGSVQVLAYILQGVVRAHGDGYNKGKRTMGLPRENNRMSIQGRSQNRVGLMVTRWGVMPSPRLCLRAALSRNKK